jgi:hypothetical protein
MSQHFLAEWQGYCPICGKETTFRAATAARHFTYGVYCDDQPRKTVESLFETNCPRKLRDAYFAVSCSCKPKVIARQRFCGQYHANIPVR